MVIVSNKSGQLANRMILFAHFIANAKEYGYQVANPSFHDYAHYFPSIRDDFFCCYPARVSQGRPNRALQGVFFKLLKKGTSLCGLLRLKGRRLGVLDITASDRGSQDFDMNAEPYLGAVRRSQYLFAKGWLFRDSVNFNRHADTIREVFAPDPAHAGRVDELMERARPGCDLLVGVHVRQGDYQKWQQGKFFYTSEQYAGLMRRYRDTLAGRRVRFLVCSNAPQDPALFEGLDVVFGNDHPLEDLYSFARCDRLLGPPSTYTWWASFYGSVPLCVVERPDQAILEDAFRVCHG